MTEDPSDSPARTTTGVDGLNAILGGGYPTARNALVVGQAGTGKTLLSLAFLVDGCQRDEPGVLVSFDESPADLARNVASLGWDLTALQNQNRLRIIDASPPPEEHAVGDGFDLGPLLIRLQQAIQATGARRVVLDAVDNFFSRLEASETLVRREIRRLLRWLKEQGVTALLSVESGDGRLTRSGIAEYLCDTVIVLSLEVREHSATRHLRVAKLRGGRHSANNQPFLIGAEGPVVAALSSLDLNYPVTGRLLGVGVAELDRMLGGGLHQGSTALVSGPAGSGKSTFGASFAGAACQRGERALLLSFEESPGQILRNMASSGQDLGRFQEAGLLRIAGWRPTKQSLENHLAEITEQVRRFDPAVVVIDPISCFTLIGNRDQITAMLIRLIDLLKSRQKTLLMTYLIRQQEEEEATALSVSSVADVWLILRNVESSGEFNHNLYVVKNRGRAHSNQIREYRISDTGIRVPPVYVGPEGVLTGAARAALEAREAAEQMARQQAMETRRRRLAVREQRLEREIARLRAEFDEERLGLEEELRQLEERERRFIRQQQAMQTHREGDPREGDASS